VEGASGSCFAIWMGPSAAVPEGLVVPAEHTQARPFRLPLSV
jgi:hypothetical protein